jgi:signal recognition particle receptor subunit beta
MDQNRLNIAKAELETLFLSEELRGVPLLIFANKQDLPESMTPGEVEARLSIKTLCSGGIGREYRVMGSCGVTGEGIGEGMIWLSGKIREFQAKKPRL